ncbi:hypothetical protein ANSO36C_55330 [Nostoc cf. commune SO-36]|uniref:Uncharacterized protein n=1 Tax=Nostoc cf. commune SO-36 TaxID=449208 RepID=A0ABN6Q969_NOSCO|nr:hypothetical protein ANSO36C_55330 [Nostoc cf. commune SO-36]
MRISTKNLLFWEWKDELQALKAEFKEKSEFVTPKTSTPHSPPTQIISKIKYDSYIRNCYKY